MVADHVVSSDSDDDDNFSHGTPVARTGLGGRYTHVSLVYVLAVWKTKLEFVVL